MSREQQERERQKALLLRLIQQQRLDLSASHRHWLEATAPIDRGWNACVIKGSALSSFPTSSGRF